MTRLTDDERGGIIRLLQGGLSVHATARQVGRGKATVSRVAAEAGLSLERSAPKKATAARRELSRRGRLELLEALAAAVWERLEAGELDPRGLRDTAVAAGITVQRAREEEDKAQPQGGVNVFVYVPSNQRGPLPADTPVWQPPVIDVTPGRMLPASSDEE